MLFSAQRYSPTLLKIYINHFFKQIVTTVSLCAIGMYVLYYAYKKLHCPLSVRQVLGTNWLTRRDNVVYWIEPKGRSFMISYASKSIKRLSRRISVKVCGVVSPFVSGLWSYCDVCNKLLSDRAYDDLCICVRCGLCSESVCVILWWTGLAVEWIVLMGER